MNDLITIEKPKALTVFTTPDGLKPILEQIAAEARALTPDVSSAKGRKEIASIAYKVAQSKTYIDGVGKDLVADMKELPKKVDAARKDAREFLDALKDEIRAPLDAWEAEQARIEAEKKAEEDAAALAKQIELDHEMALLMNDAHDRRKEDEARQAEQDRIERENQIRIEAEQKAKEDAERQILAAKLATERAEREKIEAEQRAARAEQEAAERAKQAEIDAVEREKQAADQERRRIEAENRMVEEENARRQADVEHKRQINRLVLNDLVQACELSEDQAKDVITAIATGKVNNVIIRY